MKTILIFIADFVNMKNTIFLIFLLLTACATPKPIPISYNCPVIKLPPEPTPIIKKLTPKSRPDEVVQAYAATVVQFRGWDYVVREQVNHSR